MSINRVVISGNLTRDAELRSTASGMPVLGIGIAVNDRRKNQQSGEWEDYPNFIDCTMFGTRASSISRFLTKGTKVVIEGKLRYSQWEREGQKRSKIEVIVDDIDFMSSRNSDASRGSSYGGNSGYSSNSSNASSASNGGYGAGGSYAPAAPASYGVASGGYTAPAPQPASTPAAPVIDASSSVYDDDIPF